MHKRFLFLLLLSAVLLPGARAVSQLSFSGEASANLVKSDSRQAPRNVDRGRPTFGWRFDLFADAVISDNIAILSNLRVLTGEDFTFDFLALRFIDLTPLHFNIQVGKFDMPFGNLGERRFATKNALYSLPLMYEYATSLPSRPVPVTELRDHRGEGYGMRLLDYGIYDVGGMLYGSADVFSYAFAISNGTVSAPSNRLQNTNSDLGKIARVTVTPFPELTLGASYAWGAYMTDPGPGSPGYGILPDPPAAAAQDVNDYMQRSAAADLELSYDRFVLYAQALRSAYDTDLESGVGTISALGWYGEAQYRFLPRWHIAFRANGIHFSDMTVEGRSLPWEYDILEFEGGIGYHLDRNALVKGVYRLTRTQAPGTPRDHLAAVQAAVRF